MPSNPPFKALEIGPDGWAHGIMLGRWQIDPPKPDSDDCDEISEIVNADDCAAMIAAFKAGGEPLLVDRDHTSDCGDTTEAYGWINDMRPCADGAEVLLELTDIGRQAIAGKRWRYLSPVFPWEDFKYDDTARLLGHPRRVARFAFTNRPRMRGIRPVVNAEGGKPQTTPRKGISMDYKAKLLSLLGLAAEATDEEIQIALDAAAADQADTEADAAMTAAGLPEDEAVRDPVREAFRASADTGLNAIKVAKAALNSAKPAAIETTARVRGPFRPLQTEARTTPPALHAADAAKSAARTTALNSILAANPGMDRTVAWDQTRREHPHLFH